LFRDEPHASISSQHENNGNVTMKNIMKTRPGSPGPGNRAGGARRQLAALPRPLRSGRKLCALALCGALAVTWAWSRAEAQTSPPRPNGPALVGNTTSGQALPAQMPATAPTLSPQANLVRDVASRRGDRTYLMLDKARGVIILFFNGDPVYAGAALTGQYPADVLPPGLTGRSFTTQAKLEEKVTPAGRFTLTRILDAHYGTAFTVNEIRGVDWVIAIHRVSIVPSEHRPERLRSSNASDRQITNGCVNVGRDTIGVLERYLTGQNIPIYILPQNPNVTLTLFASAQTGVWR
jgi:hypothetical protein